MKVKRQNRLNKRIKRKRFVDLYFSKMSNIGARNYLLANASCYYEFPMLEIKNPPSNSQINYNLVHAFQKAGFEAKNHSNYHQNDKYSDSYHEIPFEGIIRGKEFQHIKKIPVWVYILTALTVIGVIIPLIIESVRRRNIPITGSIVYWGQNKYDFKKLAPILGDTEKFSGDLEVSNIGTLLRHSSRFHPVSTTLHIAIGFEIRPKRFLAKDPILSKFSILKNYIYRELGVQPIPFEYKNSSQESNALSIFRWKKQDLRDIQSRFPMN